MNRRGFKKRGVAGYSANGISERLAERSISINSRGCIEPQVPEVSRGRHDTLGGVRPLPGRPLSPGHNLTVRGSFFGPGAGGWMIFQSAESQPTRSSLCRRLCIGQAVTATVAAAARFRRRCSSIATDPITSDIVLARPVGSISGTAAPPGVLIPTPATDS